MVNIADIMQNNPIAVNNVRPGIKKLWKGECCKTLSTVIPKPLPEGSTIIDNPAASAFKPVTNSRIIPIKLRVFVGFMFSIIRLWLAI